MKGISRKLLCGMISIFLLAATMSGCTGAAPTTTATTTTTETATDNASTDSTVSNARTDIVVALNQEPATLDPNNMGDGAGFMVASNIFESLLWLTDDLEIEPLLAKSWDISEDGLVYTFYLQENVTFQNGDPFTANDCQYTYNRAMQGGYAGSVTAVIESTKVVDLSLIHI